MTQSIIPLLSLIALEVILGIDNIIFFLMMIGVSLIAEGFHFEIPKGYIYFSMAFAFLVDIIQMKTVKHK